MKPIHKITFIFISIMILVFPIFAHAVIIDDSMDLYPQKPGTKLFILYYDKITADSLYANGTKVNDDFNLDGDIVRFRGGAYYKIGPFNNLTDIIFPFGSISADTTVDTPGGPVGVHLSSPSGMGDMVLHNALFLLNDPESQLYGGPDIFITAPTGEYENSKDLNLGCNRWAFKPGFGIVKGIGTKGTFVQLKGSVEFYTKNNDFTEASLEQEKDPLLHFESFFIQFIERKTFLSLGYFYQYGGETKVDGVSQNDRTKTHTIQFNVSRMITEDTQLMLKYNKDLDVENGTKNDAFSLRLSYLFNYK